MADQSGFFAQADGGTLFLDEIGELSLDIQSKLLRAIEYGEIQALRVLPRPSKSRSA